MVASHALPTGDLACNPGLCPDWESNPQPFGSQAGAQSTEPHQRGPDLKFYEKISELPASYSQLSNLPVASTKLTESRVLAKAKMLYPGPIST